MKKRMIFMSFALFLFFLIGVEVDAKSGDTYIDEEYQQYCVETGEEYGVCPELLMAIIEAESSGIPSATNGDCKGLMQVSERWHKDRMEKLSVTDICDPYGNILVGTDYLMELAEQYEDVAVALAVYNGDSKALNDGYVSNYAAKILERSAELERLHGK